MTEPVTSKMEVLFDIEPAVKLFLVLYYSLYMVNRFYCEFVEFILLLNDTFNIYCYHR